jgi:hypothetical protein
MLFIKRDEGEITKPCYQNAIMYYLKVHNAKAD